MRLVDGPDLKALLAADGPFEPARAVRVVSQLADALASAHAAGLVHRDVKPRNVLVAASAAGEHAYLVDFGLARRLQGDGSLTTDGRCAGTLDYMAPELLRGHAAAAAADIYSLGCLLYELLMGRVPFPADNEAAKITSHLLRRPPTVTLRDPAAAALNAVVQRAMSKSPAIATPARPSSRTPPGARSRSVRAGPRCESSRPPEPRSPATRGPARRPHRRALDLGAAATRRRPARHAHGPARRRRDAAGDRVAMPINDAPAGSRRTEPRGTAAACCCSSTTSTPSPRSRARDAASANATSGSPRPCSGHEGGDATRVEPARPSGAG